CDFSTTAETLSYMLPEGAPPRSTDGEEKAKLLYRGICAGCHGYDVRMVGPATVTIQALYGDDAQALADYIAKPVRKRNDYPEMPPQDHLSEELRLQVATYMLREAR
ncbi:MAG TPA: c-type cytochrome, partial [Xanthomonadales bacterium]|nr:c-type cytochrome [Xanthomonadales bacterium]